MTRSSAVVRYANKASIDGNSNKDMAAGYEACVVGSNSPAMNSVGPGTLVVVTNKETICIGEVIRTATEDETRTWIDRGGLNWKFNFKVRWLTEIVLITKLVELTIKELCDYSGQDSKKFFHPVCHSSNFRSVVSKLVDNL